MAENIKRGKNKPTDVAIKPGWVEIKIPASYGQGKSFLHSGRTSSRLRIRYFKKESDGALMAKVWFGPASEGPPGYAHGGSMAAVLDEAMGMAVLTNGLWAVSAKIEIDYRTMLPLKTATIVETWIEKIRGRKVVAKGKIVNNKGIVYSEGKGLFITIDPARFELLPSKEERSKRVKQK